MTYLSVATRQRVRQRAGHRCEYCLSPQDYILGRLQVDHVIPVAKGGSAAKSNLCLACELCNQYKWAKTEGIDPLTLKRVALFHPRLQQWSEHFTWSEDGTEIVGRTGCGRVVPGDCVLRCRNPPFFVGWAPPTIRGNAAVPGGRLSRPVVGSAHPCILIPTLLAPFPPTPSVSANPAERRACQGHEAPKGSPDRPEHRTDGAPRGCSRVSTWLTHRDRTQIPSSKELGHQLRR
jgi:hypothetical protein